MLVNSMLGFSGIMSFGMTGATVKYVAKYRAQNDEHGVSTVVQSALTLYLILGVLTSCSLYLAAPLLIEHVFTVQQSNSVLAIQSVQIAGIGLTVRFVDEVFLALFQGYERYDLAAIITIPTNLVTFAINVVLVSLGYDISYILLASLAILGFSSFIKLIIGKIVVLPSLSIIPRLNRTTMNEIFGFGLYSWLQSIGSVLFSQIDRLIIASVLGTTVLAYYSVAMQLAQQISTLLSRTVAFIFPLSSAAHERGDVAKMRAVYFTSMKFVVVAAVAMGAPMYIFSSQILTFWMGSDFAVHSAPLLRILSVSSVLLATSVVPFYYMNGTGYVRFNTLATLTSGSMVALATIITIPLYGANGAVWSRFAMLPVSIVSRTILHYKVFQDRRWYIGALIIMPALIPFVFANSIFSFISTLNFSLYTLSIGITLTGVIHAVVVMLLSFVIYKNKTIKDHM